MTLAGMQRGTLETARDTGERVEPELAEPPPRVTDAAVHERFNLHASVHLPAHDDLARERLCRYLARPAFSLARFGVRRDGLVVYRVKNAGRGRIKQRVMSPVECLARLAAMVPPPRYPLPTLLRRTFDADVKRCHGCGGRMTVRALVTDAASIARLLGALRRSREPPLAA